MATFYSKTQPQRAAAPRTLADFAAEYRRIYNLAGTNSWLVELTDEHGAQRRFIQRFCKDLDEAILRAFTDHNLPNSAWVVTGTARIG